MPRGTLKTELVPPTRGVRTDLPRHQVPDGFLAAGENVLCRDGQIYTRPGYAALTTTAPSSNRMMGGIHYFDNTNTQRVVVGTTGSLHSFDGTSWSSITGLVTWAGGNSDQVRFGVFPRTTTTRLIAVNDVNVPIVWTGSGNFAALGGSPPIAKCVAVAFERVILANLTVGGTRRSSDLAISGFQDPTLWDLTNRIVSLTDTKDSIVEVKALNAQVFAIYKDRSQWIGIGAGSLFPFVFELRDQQTGPVSPAVVVQAENDHYYVGQDGDIYQFDGNRCRSIGGWVRRLIQNDLDFTNQAQAHGFYDRLNREIWWFWPSYRTVGRSSGIVYRLPYQDVPGAFSPLMTYASNVTMSMDWRDTQTFGWNDLTGTWDGLSTQYATWNDFPNLSQLGSLIGDSGGQVHRFGRAASDAGTFFDASWDFPFRALGGVGENTRVDVIESFFRETLTSVSAQIVLITSDTLGTDGTVVTAQTVDLSAGTRLRASYEDQQARYVSVRHRLLGATGLQQYRGGTVFCFKRGER